MKNIIFKDNISKSYIHKKKFNKTILKSTNNLNSIYKRIDYQKDIFYSLSRKFKLNFTNKELKKYNRFKTVAILGIGGSVLGAKAIYTFLKQKKIKKFIFFDNLDENKINDFIKSKKASKTLFIIISKSGNTLETIVNVNSFPQKIFTPSNTIIITEKKNSALNSLITNLNVKGIVHKNYIGGRYSVLSEVGMVPAHFMGLKIKNFRNNLLSIFKGSKKKMLLRNVAQLFQIYSSKKIKSIVFLNYSPELNDFLYWLQQLISESLGKNGKGLMPSISQAPKDHHSLLQLYLDGPRDKLFYVFSSSNLTKLKIKNNLFGKKYNFLKKKRVSKVILSQKKSFINTLKKKDISYREFHINKISEESIGELFSYFMVETALLGKVINVNPFDQPAVESVKKLTIKYLN
jgi:glucose-6-phosphate isomerase